MLYPNHVAVFKNASLPMVAAPSLAGGWTNYGSAIISTGQTVTTTLSTETGASGFYRIRVTRAP